ncbi:MAG: hypothetical protein Q9195_006971 [Heterodermia aff. obscurata]
MDSVHNRALKRRLQQLHQDHDRQENLGGLSLMKSWGLASIPQDGLVTACISLHPGDMPEYVTPALEKSVIVFASDISEDRTETFPWQEVPVVWDVTTTQKAIIEAVSDYNKFTNGTSTDFSIKISAAASAAEHFLADTDDKQRETIDELCAICEDTIPFDSLTQASCLQGHQCSELMDLFGALLHFLPSPVPVFQSVANAVEGNSSVNMLIPPKMTRSSRSTMMTITVDRGSASLR